MSEMNELLGEEFRHRDDAISGYLATTYCETSVWGIRTSSPQAHPLWMGIQVIDICTRSSISHTKDSVVLDASSFLSGVNTKKNFIQVSDFEKTRKWKLSNQLKIFTVHMRYCSSVTSSVTCVLFLANLKRHA
ncbi:hypothetical protein llap_15534 [Limosa lapponica baueri]|uniref:Uncharacterized protein n=1 Tax=Limosa lapponica baueri TaxID=1758121 RepID=A0A2I0TK69_LIMLA|nr:hypothetical protein llap_15534 [Limosa lapponica baueri]